MYHMHTVWDTYSIAREIIGILFDKISSGLKYNKFQYSVYLNIGCVVCKKIILMDVDFMIGRFSIKLVNENSHQIF